MPVTATCSACGATFEVPDSLQERYPGWTPSRCQACHSGGRGNGSRTARRSGDRTLTRRGAAEGELTPAQVLERFTAGPTSGVFTDGSADPNPGPGGWGAVYVRDDRIVDQASGHEPETTNNRMELRALIAGYDLVPEGEAATVYSDSNYCVQMINQWADEWARNGWRRKAGPVKNLDLVKELYQRSKARPELTLRWIKAHDGSRWNEYADALSVDYRRS